MNTAASSPYPQGPPLHPSADPRGLRCRGQLAIRTDSAPESWNWRTTSSYHASLFISAALLFSSPILAALTESITILTAGLCGAVLVLSHQRLSRVSVSYALQSLSITHGRAPSAKVWEIPVAQMDSFRVDGRDLYIHWQGQLLMLHLKGLLAEDLCDEVQIEADRCGIQAWMRR